ncbi:MAG: hypothetical protein V3V08_19785 [Nannocystaceae bacterium]
MMRTLYSSLLWFLFLPACERDEVPETASGTTAAGTTPSSETSATAGTKTAGSAGDLDCDAVPSPTECDATFGCQRLEGDRAREDMACYLRMEMAVCGEVGVLLDATANAVAPDGTCWFLYNFPNVLGIAPAWEVVDSGHRCYDDFPANPC